jgi:AcrR family transcriptional regulator
MGTKALATRVDAQANRARLLEAATAVLAEQGPSVDVKAIADRAGLAVGTIYRHFAGKDELVAAVMAAAVQEFSDAVTAGAAEADPLTGLRVFLCNGLAVFARYGELMAAMLDGREPAARDVAMREYRRTGTSTRITGLVRRAAEAGEVRSDVPVEVLAATVKGVFAPWVQADLRRSWSAQAITEYILCLLRPVPPR